MDKGIQLMADKKELNWIAESDLMIEMPDGKRSDILIALSEPVEENGGQEFHCQLKLEGLKNEPYDIYGLDSIQTIGLAMALLRRELDNCVSQEMNFYLQDYPDQPVDILQMFFAVQPHQQQQ
ncbi:DUF6968 family protein [Pelagibaculum spongiae]|uniref:DUF6968 domain-containing protein n=1 Tax=Pelagibaculum spongiae TaxID=2080658 RepID=A0A2V1GTA7_9GAMM|nr:hypothetical protein [Pelagibaculum spongiae]PVZ68254.1 hypothetical protein DC094_13235 [Pelagibaculum spongiae]